MDEDEKYWEQPEDLVLDENSDGSQQGEEKEEAQEIEAKGETIGKFKNVGDLLDAYNNLEKEFTKKCQQLAEFEKDKMQESEKSNEEIEQKLKSFLLTNGEANSYAEELKKKVLGDEKLKKMDDPFSFVWAEHIYNNLKTPNKISEEVVGYVFNNEQLKNMVLEKYVNQLSENSSPIKISSSGKRVANPVTQTPQNLKEAKDYLFNLFSK